MDNMSTDDMNRFLLGILGKLEKRVSPDKSSEGSEVTWITEFPFQML